MVDKKRKWQNLFYKRCPNCGEKLKETVDYLSCLNPHQTKPNYSCFFVKKSIAVEYLRNTDHPANFCLTAAERDKLEEVIDSMINFKE